MNKQVVLLKLKFQVMAKYLLHNSVDKNLTELIMYFTPDNSELSFVALAMTLSHIGLATTLHIFI
jgi:hypothetical protein